MKLTCKIQKSQRLAWGFVFLICGILPAHTSQALPYEITYLGRLTENNGMPIAGPINLEVKFYRSETGSDLIPISPLTYNALPLADGVFQIKIALTPANFHIVFPDDSSSVFVEVTDLTHGKTYKRQKYGTVPYALKVPVDGNSVAYDSSGRLTVSGIKGSALPSSNPTTGQVIKWGNSGWEWGNDNTSAAGSVDSSAIQDGSISNADIATGAAISGAKISPNFGSQNITTSGVISGNGSGLTNLPASALGTSIDSAEIDDSTIVDADISGTAAIAQSKISGLSSSLALKEPLLGAGNSAQYFRGDKSWSTLDTSAVPENTNLYYTDGRARSAISSTGPVVYNSATGAISMAAATSVASGYLSSGDWLSFNNKQAAIGAGSTVNAGSLSSTLQNGLTLKPFGVAAGQAGEIRFTEVTGSGSNYIGFKAPDDISVNKIWTLPSLDGTSGQVLTTDGSGFLSWTTVSGGGGGSGTVTDITAGAGLSGGTITTSGTISLANTAVTAGTYSRANITVDAQGRLTSAANGSAVNLSTDVSGTLALAYGGTGSATAAGARSNLGLGSVSMLSTVSSAEITNDTITDADISTSAAIDQSKINGLSTSLAGKEPSIGMGTTSEFFRGDKSWTTLNTSAVSEGTNFYYTDARARNAFSVTAPVAYNSATGTFSMAPSGVTAGSYPPPAAMTIDTYGRVTSVSAATNMTLGSMIYLDGSAGNVGIGTNSPTVPLEIYSNTPQAVKVTNPSTTNSASLTLTAGRPYTVGSGGPSESGVANKFYIRDQAASTYRLLIDQTGKVGIGTGIGTLSNTLQVQGSLCVQSSGGACAGNTAGTIYATTASVTAADLAEHMPVPADNQLIPGDVVKISSGYGAQAEFAATTRAYQENAAGVISTAPGIALGNETKNSKPVALAGRVPVNVNLENGPINIGDYLVSSSTPGKAMRASGPGVPGVLGVALSAYTGVSIPVREWDDGIAHEQGHQVMLLVQTGAGAGTAISELQKRTEAAEVKYEKLQNFLCEKFADAPGCSR